MEFYFLDPGTDSSIEGGHVLLQGLADPGRMLADTFDQLAAINLHGAVEFRQVPSDELAKTAAVAGDLLGKFRTRQGHDLLKRAQLRGEHVFNGVALNV